MSTTSQTSSQSVVTNIATTLLHDGINTIKTNRFAQVGCALGGILALRGMPLQ